MKSAFQSDIEKLGNLIQGIHFAMLTTVEHNGELRSRPMATQKTPFDGELWFFTWNDSPKILEVEHERHVNLSYSDPTKNTFVSVSGVAELVSDRSKIEALWNPIYKAWFPKGLEDPKLGLLKISVHHAQYWDTPSSKMVQLVGFAKALLTGKTYSPGPGEQGKVDLAG